MIILETVIMWEHIYRTKDNWKKNTFEIIKNRILLVKDNRFVQYNQRTSTQLVCLYGESQVGKTTLILYLIGLKEEYVSEVQKVLRGGVELGNSSTSTAIMYSQNDDCNPKNSCKYGIRYETLNDGNHSSKTLYYTSEEMIQELKAIRGKVEQNKFIKNEIVHIYIPKEYFDINKSKSKNYFLDLPGINSRNQLEKDHVNSIVNRYIPISSVCMIVSLANEMETLKEGKVDFPNDINWRNLSHKYIVVLTNSLFQDYVVNFLQRSKSLNHENLSDFVKNTIKSEIINKEIFDAKYKTQIFPVDIGSSFIKLLNNIREEDREELIKTRDFFLNSLQEYILNHKEEPLFSSIADLYDIVHTTDEEQIAFLKSAIEELENNLNRTRNKKKCLIEKNNSFLEAIEKNNTDIDKFQKTLNKLPDAKKIENELIKGIENEISKYVVIENGVKYFNDQDKKILAVLKGQITNLFSEIKSNIEEVVKINAHDSDILFEFCNKYENLLYPPKRFTLFRKYEKIELDSATTYLRKIGTIYQSKLVEPCSIEINNKKNCLLDENKAYKKQINNRVKKLKQVEDKINEQQIDKNKKELEIESAILHQRQDEQTLNDYLAAANDAYHLQKKEVYEKINSSVSSRAEKLMYVLLLPVLEKEYKSFKEASNG